MSTLLHFILVLNEVNPIGDSDNFKILIFI